MTNATIGTNSTSGCQVLVILCPYTTRFTVTYANGAVVTNNYVSPIVLLCSATDTGPGVSSGADESAFARLRLFGIQFQSAPSVFWIGAVTGFQVTACYCSASKCFVLLNCIDR